MLSILIPTYNYDCAELVAELHRQAVAEGIEFEIVVANDCSSAPLPRLEALVGLEHFRLISPKKNLGRARIRNFLANNARYETLLFIDSDSLPANDDYVAKYIALASKHKIVLGGRVYRKPEDARHTLLPKYGQKEKNKDGVHQSETTFTSPNFLIDKTIFNTVCFNENLRGYGHEDTLFGVELHRHGIPFYKTNNPVIHLLIEDNVTFLKKTREAVEHLYQIHTSGEYPELDNQSPLLHTFRKIKHYRMTGRLSTIYHSYHTTIERRLDTTHPSIHLFSIYKLLYICALHNKF